MNRRPLSLTDQSRSDQRAALAGGRTSLVAPPASNSFKPIKATDSLSRVNLTVGQQRALEGLERGRRNAIIEARTTGAVNAIRVMEKALIDLNAGGPTRGRAKRIAIDLDGELTERAVLRILDRLSVCPIASVHNGENLKEVSHAK